MQELVSLGKNHVSGLKHGKTRMQSVGSMLCQLSIVVHCIPRAYVIPIVGLSGSHSKRYIPRKKNIDSDMLCWQDGSFLGLETQIDPYTSSGYMLALLAMLLQEYAGIDESWKKNHVSGVKHGKTRMQSVGSMLCQLSIVVHCIPRVYVISFVGLAGLFYMFLQEKMDPRETQKTHQGLCLFSNIKISGSMFV